VLICGHLEVREIILHVDSLLFVYNNLASINLDISNEGNTGVLLLGLKPPHFYTRLNSSFIVFFVYCEFLDRQIKLVIS
jgi:hypothetical protein